MKILLILALSLLTTQAHAFGGGFIMGLAIGSSGGSSSTSININPHTLPCLISLKTSKEALEVDALNVVSVLEYKITVSQGFLNPSKQVFESRVTMGNGYEYSTWTRKQEVLQKISSCQEESNIKSCFLTLPLKNNHYGAKDVSLNAYYILSVSESSEGSYSNIDLVNNTRWSTPMKVSSIKEQVTACRK